MDDLISRAELLDEFHSLCGPQTGDGWDNMGVRNLIMRQKAVDAVPVVHAKWIETKIPANTTGHGGVGQDKKNGWLCSNCRCAFDAKLLWCKNYCPYCGAKMDGEQRDDNGADA